MNVADAIKALRNTPGNEALMVVLDSIMSGGKASAGKHKNVD